MYVGYSMLNNPVLKFCTHVLRVRCTSQSPLVVDLVPIPLTDFLSMNSHRRGGHRPCKLLYTYYGNLFKNLKIVKTLEAVPLRDVTVVI